MKSLTLWMGSLFLLCACVASRPDRFYVLDAQPSAAGGSRSAFGKQVMLSVTLPSLVDRNEMVLTAPGNGIVILDHERWAAPLADQVLATLGRDIERRRADLLVADQRLGHSGIPGVKITVDVVQLSALKGSRVSIETRWRILDLATGQSVLGAEQFAAPTDSDGYDAIARALSVCLGSLADRLVGRLPS